MDPTGLAPLAHTHTLRVTIAFEGSTLTLAGVQRVAMQAGAPTAPPPREGQTGFWLEVRDAAGHLLWHRVLHDPMPQDVEAFGPPGAPIARRPAPRAHGTFEVLVPDLAEARTLTLFGAPAPAGRAPEPARPLLRLAFDALHRALPKPRDPDPTP